MLSSACLYNLFSQSCAEGQNTASLELEGNGESLLYELKINIKKGQKQ